MTTPKSSIRDGWFKEWLTPHESHAHRLRRTLVRTRTKFQNAVIADTASFGRCLILDGEMQSAAADEFIYHEALVHPALMSHPNPKSVLILGGGEGATVREILKHRTIEKIVMVDIDGAVIDFCRKHLPTWHQGCFSSKKLELVVDDAKKYVETTPRRFDVIISDLPTPTDGGPAYQLYTLEFYRTMLKRLQPGGLFVMQAGSGSLLQIEVHSVIHSTLRRLFRRVRPYYAYVPSFDVPWAYIIGTNGKDPLSFTSGQIDAMIRRRIKGPLSYYDGQTHAGLLGVPKNIRALLAREKRVITRSRSIYFYK
jgi:spermidine synthase